MLLGRTPKDFDIATDARPNQIRKYFANAFIIGRRFRLAHIRFRDGKVDRGGDLPQGSRPRRRDARRRPGARARRCTPSARRRRTPGAATSRSTPCSTTRLTATVIDHVGGVADLRQGRIRIIGDAGERFREDPVRIWRVIRYAARLGFAIDAGDRRRHPRAARPAGRLFGSPPVRGVLQGPAGRAGARPSSPCTANTACCACCSAASARRSRTMRRMFAVSSLPAGHRRRREGSGTGAGAGRARWPCCSGPGRRRSSAGRARSFPGSEKGVPGCRHGRGAAQGHARPGHRPADPGRPPGARPGRRTHALVGAPAAGLYASLRGYAS